MYRLFGQLASYERFSEVFGLAGAFRIGVGYDIHRLVEGRPLVLGGVRIESDRGLLGHSDGDAVLHAVTDALLGAAGLGDIGQHFPDTDPAFAGIDSRELLSRAMGKIREAGFTPGNIDVIVHAERPKLTHHKDAMADSIANLVGLERGQVNVKAKTNEGLGPLGHGDGIACTAAATVLASEGD